MAGEQRPKHMGFMLIAKRPCGRVSAAAWDEPGSEVDLEKSKAEWTASGDSIERIERFVGDPEPEWICRPGCNNCHPTAGVTASK